MTKKTLELKKPFNGFESGAQFFPAITKPGGTPGKNKKRGFVSVIPAEERKGEIDPLEKTFGIPRTLLV